MTTASRREELLTLFAQTRSILDEFIASRSQEEQQKQAQQATTTQETTPWSAKDLLAAIGFWMDYTVERLGYFVRGEMPPQEVDFGAVEAHAVEQQKTHSWSTVVASVDQSLASLMTAVAQFPDETFSGYNSYGDEAGGEVWGEVRANGFIWPLQELEKYYQHVGEQAHAEAIRERLEAVLGKPELIVCDLIAPQEVQAQQALVIDVRDAKEYTEGHVAGAINVPVATLQSNLAAYQSLLQGRPVVTYCNMHHPGQSRGERAAAWLHEQGYQAMALQGGFPAWQKAGLPVETKETPPTQMN